MFVIQSLQTFAKNFLTNEFMNGFSYFCWNVYYIYGISSTPNNAATFAG